MPYTLAHPAAVIPLRKIRRLNPLGLIVGAMAPDFEHLLRVNPVSLFSHSFAALVWFCVPLGLGVMWLFRGLWRRPLLTVFPRVEALDTKAGVVSDVGSLLIGAFTHLLWDAFTHGPGFGVSWFPVLNAEIALGPLGAKPVWALLQHLSTGFGLAVLGTSIFLAVREVWGRRQLASVAAMVAVLTLLSVLMTFVLRPHPGFRDLVVVSSNNFIILLFIGLTVSGLWMRRSQINCHSTRAV